MDILKLWAHEVDDVESGGFLMAEGVRGQNRYRQVVKVSCKKLTLSSKEQRRYNYSDSYRMLSCVSGRQYEGAN